MFTLTPDEWHALSPYLDEALAMADTERSIWLSSLRSENPNLVDQLELLLSEHRALSEKGFLERGPLGFRGSSGLQGQIVGVYTLISQIGQGGMGSVWLAERNDGRFERRVAVKFLNIALMGMGGEERFKREGRILALLVHPHIAELIDAGVSQVGQPYLILEYVGNDGSAKLLDFGIAKLLESDRPAAEVTWLTAEGGRAMTPEYAAPEQLKGEAVTTATDVYALGVLLYVLLTGQHPAGSGPHTPADLVKAVVDTQPPLPSEIVVQSRTPADSLARNAANRGSTPDKLHRLLRGDLDTIVAKALKKDPSERYASVTALAEELRRYLRNEPISARPDTLGYRAAKFVRRNRTAVALAALAVTAIAAGLVGTLIQARTARRERDFALQQLVRAHATIEFNEFLLSDAAPSGKPFTVNELLGRAETILARQHSADDTSRVQLMVVIGDQYSTQDEDAKAHRILEEAHTLSRQVHASYARAEASCSLAGALARDGELPRAEALIQEGLHELPAGNQYDVDRIFCLRRGSEVAQERGDSQQGIARMQKVQEILKRSPYDSDVLELHASTELAEAYRVAGQNQLASSTFEKAAALLAPLGRTDTQSAVVIFNDWALALDKLGQPLEAEKLFRRAIDISRAGQTEDTVSPILLNNYAKTLDQLGRLDEAADYAERAYAQAPHSGDPLVLRVTLLERALISIEQRDFDRAATVLADLEPKLRESLPPDNFWFGAFASAQSLLASGRGSFQTALPLADQAVEIVEAASKAGRAGSDFLPIAILRRSTIELDAERFDRAEADARRALELLKAALPPGAFSSFVGRAYLNVGRSLQSQGKRDEAQAAFRSAAEHLLNTLGPDHREARNALRLAESQDQRR
jgi:tetratricopeptide (TPR) repeat protein